MTAIEITWLSLLTLLASWFGALTVINPIYGFLLRIRPSAAEVGPLATIVVFLLVHVAGAIVLAAYISPGGAIIGISVAALVWGLFCYFFLQRFAQPEDLLGLSLTSPLVLPVASLVSFVSTAIAFLLYSQWYFAFVPFLVWLVLGFTTAELAIRRCIKRSRNAGAEWDRRFAMSIVNDAQGRRAHYGLVRYPFP